MKTGQKIGYVRVSTPDQCPDRQIDALSPICDELYVETFSASAAKRPVFEQVLGLLAEGDTLVVWDLDRAFRSTISALTEAQRLQDRGVNFHVVNLGFDTSSEDGKLFYTIVAAFAEHERNRLSRRTKEGLQAARRKGKRLGRRPKISDEQVRLAKTNIEAGRCTAQEAASQFGVDPWTISRRIRELCSD
ncbi:MAG: recombinase family protein [Hyphomicrobiaceae bacterium]